MHLKRFYAADVREALAQAREELGSDALVLSTRLIAQPGWRGWIGGRHVEVTAAIDRVLSEDRTGGLADRHRDAVPEDCQAIVARLRAAGLDPLLSAEVAAAIPPARRRSPSAPLLQRALADRLAGLIDPRTEYAPIEVFVGPPGAGKTTTIAKIASQERARNGQRLGLVAADGFRVGAVEQLRLYADIIGAPFAVARALPDLDRAMARTARPMLVDTAGRSPSEGPSRVFFEHLSGQPGVRTHLVIAAGTAARDAGRIFDRYSAARPARIVLTKVDETESLTNLLPLLRERGLPISYLGTGQRVPEDLHRATAPLLAACLLGEPAIAPGIPA